MADAVRVPAPRALLQDGRFLIPKLITQTWRNAALPQQARPFAESWRRHNPEMTYRLFDDDACASVMAEAFPHYLDQYLRFPFPVMRADVFRYAVIYRDGGIYADIDMECVKPLGPLLADGRTVVSTEARLTARRQRELDYPRPLQIANCVFAANAGEPFLREAVDRAMALCAERTAIGRGDVEDLTGPRMLTRLFYEKPRPHIAVLRQIGLMAPRHYPDIWPININIHARHHFFGAWKKEAARPLTRIWIERDLWPNPYPAKLLDESFGRRTLAQAAP